MYLSTAQSLIPEIESSYCQNNFGLIFMSTIFALRPHVCVELGVFNGYSTVHIGMGLKLVHKSFNHKGHLHAYDLWEDYPYNHGNFEEVKTTIDSIGLNEYMTLNKADAFEVHKQFGHNSVCLLHVDISNDGDVIDRIVKAWHPIINRNGVMIFEGGSEERDNVEWMRKYNKLPIKPAIENNKILNGCYIYGTYEKFPSMTIALKKLEDPDENK